MTQCVPTDSVKRTEAANGVFQAASRLARCDCKVAFLQHIAGCSSPNSSSTQLVIHRIAAGIQAFFDLAQMRLEIHAAAQCHARRQNIEYGQLNNP